MHRLYERSAEEQMLLPFKQYFCLAQNESAAANVRYEILDKELKTNFVILCL